MSRASWVAIVLCALLTFPLLLGIGMLWGPWFEIGTIPFTMAASWVICYRVAAR